MNLRFEEILVDHIREHRPGQEERNADTSATEGVQSVEPNEIIRRYEETSDENGHEESNTDFEHALLAKTVDHEHPEGHEQDSGA